MPADAGHRLGVSFSEDLGTRIVGWLIDRRRRGHLTARHERACAAAAEAAEDDPAFAVDAIMGRTRFIAERLAAAVAAADVDEAVLREICTARLAERLAGRMLRRGSLGLFQAVPDGIELFLVGVENLQDDALDRVVVAVLGGPPTEAGTVQLAEVWSLARGEDEWLLADVEAHRAGRRHLDAPLVASPWDASEVADRATLELAAGTPAAREPDELLARDAEGLSALRDLALVDSRWAPDVLAAAVRRLLRCWEHTAVEGTTPSKASPAHRPQRLWCIRAARRAVLMFAASSWSAWTSPSCCSRTSRPRSGSCSGCAVDARCTTSEPRSRGWAPLPAIAVSRSAGCCSARTTRTGRGASPTWTRWGGSGATSGRPLGSGTSRANADYVALLRRRPDPGPA